MADSFNWSSFIEVPGFAARWEDIGCNDADLRQLQLELLALPSEWPVVSGAGGWRKARFAPLSWGKGKSGAVRVYYADLPEFGWIVLGTAFKKSELDEVSKGGKSTMARILAAIIRRQREIKNAQG